jgi:hypothetical protein
MTIISAMVLTIPIIALSFVQDREQTLVGVVAGMLLVALIIALATDCRDHEILMAVCAYVLSIFFFWSNSGANQMQIWRRNDCLYSDIEVFMIEASTSLC